MLIGTLALTGFPFLSGFYSKDAIIEFAFFEQNKIGNYVASIGIFTAFLTAIYSWRLFFKTFLGTYKNKIISKKEIHESPAVMVTPLIILAAGSIFAGYFFKDLFIGSSSDNFWNNSIFFLDKSLPDELSLWKLLITPVIVVLTIPLSYYLFLKNTDLINNFKKSNIPLYNFLINKWYIDEIYDYVFVNPLKKIGLIFWKRGDEGTIDRFGPDGIAKVVKFFTNKASQFQTGYVYDYAFVMLLGLSALITYLILT